MEKPSEADLVEQPLGADEAGKTSKEQVDEMLAEVRANLKAKTGGGHSRGTAAGLVDSFGVDELEPDIYVSPPASSSAMSRGNFVLMNPQSIVTGPNVNKNLLANNVNVSAAVSATLGFGDGKPTSEEDGEEQRSSVIRMDNIATEARAATQPDITGARPGHTQFASGTGKPIQEKELKEGAAGLARVESATVSGNELLQNDVSALNLSGDPVVAQPFHGIDNLGREDERGPDFYDLTGARVKQSQLQRTTGSKFVDADGNEVSEEDVKKSGGCLRTKDNKTIEIRALARADVFLTDASGTQVPSLTLQRRGQDFVMRGDVATQLRSYITPENLLQSGGTVFDVQSRLVVVRKWASMESQVAFTDGQFEMSPAMALRGAPGDESFDSIDPRRAVDTTTSSLLGEREGQNAKRRRVITEGRVSNLTNGTRALGGGPLGNVRPDVAAGGLAGVDSADLRGVFSENVTLDCYGNPDNSSHKRHGDSRLIAVKTLGGGFEVAGGSIGSSAEPSQTYRSGFEDLGFKVRRVLFGECPSPALCSPPLAVASPSPLGQNVSSTSAGLLQSATAKPSGGTIRESLPNLNPASKKTYGKMVAVGESAVCQSVSASSESFRRHVREAYPNHTVVNYQSPCAETFSARLKCKDTKGCGCGILIRIKVGATSKAISHTHPCRSPDPARYQGYFQMTRNQAATKATLDGLDEDTTQDMLKRHRKGRGELLASVQSSGQRSLIKLTTKLEWTEFLKAEILRAPEHRSDLSVVAVNSTMAAYVCQDWVEAGHRIVGSKYSAAESAAQAPGPGRFDLGEKVVDPQSASEKLLERLLTANGDGGLAQLLEWLLTVDVDSIDPSTATALLQHMLSSSEPRAAPTGVPAPVNSSAVSSNPSERESSSSRSAVSVSVTHGGSESRKERKVRADSYWENPFDEGGQSKIDSDSDESEEDLFNDDNPQYQLEKQQRKTLRQEAKRQKKASQAAAFVHDSVEADSNPSATYGRSAKPLIPISVVGSGLPSLDLPNPRSDVSVPDSVRKVVALVTDATHNLCKDGYCGEVLAICCLNHSTKYGITMSSSPLLQVIAPKEDGVSYDFLFQEAEKAYPFLSSSRVFVFADEHRGIQKSCKNRGWQFCFCPRHKLQSTSTYFKAGAEVGRDVVGSKFANGWIECPNKEIARLLGHFLMGCRFLKPHEQQYLRDKVMGLYEDPAASEKRWLPGMSWLPSTQADFVELGLPSPYGCQTLESRWNRWKRSFPGNLTSASIVQAVRGLSAANRNFPCDSYFGYESVSAVPMDHHVVAGTFPDKSQGRVGAQQIYRQHRHVLGSGLLHLPLVFYQANSALPGNPTYVPLFLYGLKDCSHNVTREEFEGALISTGMVRTKCQSDCECQLETSLCFSRRVYWEFASQCVVYTNSQGFACTCRWFKYHHGCEHVLAAKSLVDPEHKDMLQEIKDDTRVHVKRGKVTSNKEQAAKHLMSPARGGKIDGEVTVASLVDKSRSWRGNHSYAVSALSLAIKIASEGEVEWERKTLLRLELFLEEDEVPSSIKEKARLLLEHSKARPTGVSQVEVSAPPNSQAHSSLSQIGSMPIQRQLGFTDTAVPAAKWLEDLRKNASSSFSSQVRIPDQNPTPLLRPPVIQSKQSSAASSKSRPQSKQASKAPSRQPLLPEVSLTVRSIRDSLRDVPVHLKRPAAKVLKLLEGLQEQEVITRKGFQCKKGVGPTIAEHVFGNLIRPSP